MSKLNQVKFFFVAATLIASVSSIGLAEEQAFDFGGDPNAEIGVPGTSVVDSALDKPVPADCHCHANQASVPLHNLFEAHGGADSKKGEAVKATK